MPETGIPLSNPPSPFLQQSKGLFASPLWHRIAPQAPSLTPKPLGRRFPERARRPVATPALARQATSASACVHPAARAAYMNHRDANSAELKANAGGQHRGLVCPL